MNSFSISDLEKFSGIKAHTIRAWEQRYNALTPGRTDGNTRTYDASQLRRLLNIATLLNTDHKVRDLCTMSDEDLYKLIDDELVESVPEEEIYDHYVSQIVLAALEYDEVRFDKMFANALLRFGIRNVYIRVIYPSLVRLGLMWTKNDLRPANEHFITGLIRQKLLAATDAIAPPASEGSSWILFLPENEHHETGLLMANYVLRSAGIKTFYLGGDVNYEALKEAVKNINPDNLLLFMVRRNTVEADIESLRQIRKGFPDKKLYVACTKKRAGELKAEKGITFLHAVKDLEKELHN